MLRLREIVVWAILLKLSMTRYCFRIASGRTPGGIQDKKFSIPGPLPLGTNSTSSLSQEESDRCGSPPS